MLDSDSDEGPPGLMKLKDESIQVELEVEA
jgi:hypothetical protein